MAEELWKAVRQAKGEDDGKPAPFTEVGNDNPLPDMDLTSLYGDAGSIRSEDSRPASLRTLPPYLGEYEARTEIRALPSQRREKHEVLDAKSLTEILSTPVRCTISLAELLRLRPGLWTEVGHCLEKFKESD